MQLATYGLFDPQGGLVMALTDPNRPINKLAQALAQATQKLAATVAKKIAERKGKQ